MDIVIKKACLKDMHNLLSVQNKSFLSDYQRYGLCPSYNQTEEKITSHIMHNDVYKIMAGNQIVGDIVVVQKGEAHYHLQCICVIPEYENHGIGNTAMHFINSEYVDAALWSLVTPADKLRNHCFYQKHGFQVTREFFTETVKMVYFEKVPRSAV